MFEVSDAGPVRRLVIDNPERKNAIPREAWSELADRLEDFERSDARVLVIMGGGGDFCSGADLSAGGTAGPAGIAAFEAGMRAVGRAATALHRASKPVVAAVDGVAVGAGMNLALGCDIVIATDRARFAELFVRRGLTMDFGGIWLLPRIVGLAAARDLALTGRFVAADEALALGIVARVVAPDELEATVAETAAQLAAGAPLAQRFIKQGLDRSFELSFEEAVSFEEQTQALCLASDDATEGVRAFSEKRSPRFRGR